MARQVVANGEFSYWREHCTGRGMSTQVLYVHLCPDPLMTFAEQTNHVWEANPTLACGLTPAWTPSSQKKRNVTNCGDNPWAGQHNGSVCVCIAYSTRRYVEPCARHMLLWEQQPPLVRLPVWLRELGMGQSCSKCPRNPILPTVGFHLPSKKPQQWCVGEI
eukprot:gene19910-biopygen23519